MKPGDHVVVHTLAYCGACKWCVTGHPAWCREQHQQREPAVHGRAASRRGTSRPASFFSEYTVVQGVQCVKIDDDIPLGVACLIGCGVLTGIGSVWNRTDLGQGDTCAVFGVGGVGLNVIQGAAARRRRAGSSRSTRSPRRSRRRATSAPPTSSSPAPASTSWRRSASSSRPRSQNVVGSFGEGGVDYAFECVGHPALLQQALDMLDWGGTAVAVGVPAPTATVPVRVTAFTHVERTLTGSRAGSHRPHYDIPLIVDAYQPRHHQARRAGVRHVPARGLGVVRPRPPRGQAAARRAHGHRRLTGGSDAAWSCGARTCSSPARRRASARQPRSRSPRRARPSASAPAGPTGSSEVLDRCPGPCPRLVHVDGRPRRARRSSRRSRSGPTTSSAGSTSSSTTRASRCAGACTTSRPRISRTGHAGQLPLAGPADVARCCRRCSPAAGAGS